MSPRQRMDQLDRPSAHHGWPLHVIDKAGDDPAMERPEAFIEALRAVLAPLTRAESAS